jgi:hypothetical protein
MTTSRSLAGLVMVIALLLIAILLIWASDRITLQGERTIFAVKCEQGRWDGERCTGRLVPGDRFAFRASTVRHEVLHWIRGSQSPSGKYSDCSIKDRDNWSCEVQSTQGPRTTRAMVNGVLTNVCPQSNARYHWVSKWKWWALTVGIASFDSANGSGPDCAAG